jgi:hypothetical protein
LEFGLIIYPNLIFHDSQPIFPKMLAIINAWNLFKRDVDQDLIIRAQLLKMFLNEWNH